MILIQIVAWTIDTIQRSLYRIYTGYFIHFISIIMTPDTPYGKIIRHEVETPIIFQDDTLLIFLDYRPVSRGHALVLPIEPIDHLDDCPPELYAQLFAAVQKISKAIKQELNPKRVGIVVSGFEVPHAHIHVLPMYTGKEMKSEHDRDDSPTVPASELQDLAAKLAARYKEL